MRMEEHEIECYRKAGSIAREVVDYAKGFIKPGMKLIDIAEKIDAKIIELGGDFGFPVNLSLNEIAAHYTPGSDDETLAEGLLKVDLGVAIEGYIADTAFSLDLSGDGRFKEMIEINEKALDNVLAGLNKDSKVKDVGRLIQEVVDGKFIVIKNLSGHSLGHDMIHAGLTISNYENEKNDPLHNIAFAVEPFLTMGTGEIYEGKDSEIFMLESDRNVRDSEARKLLKFVKENYSTRPFCKRWLEKEGFKRLDFSLNLLVKEEILHNFPVLIERGKKPVSQAEHSILINDNVEVLTK